MESYQECPMCGSMVEPGSRFCEVCGYQLKKSSPADAGQDVPEKKNARTEPGKKDARTEPGKKHRGLLIAIGGGIAAVAIGIGVFIMTGPWENGSNTGGGGNPVSYSEEESGSDNTLAGVPAGEGGGDGTVSEVEKQVLDIRDQYERIMAGYNSGTYSAYAVNDKVTSYWDGDELVMIIAGRDDTFSMVRNFYYAGGELIFAYYEAEDSYRFYLDDGEVIRIRYCKNAADTQNAVNFDDPSGWGEWPGELKQSSSVFVEEASGIKEYMDLSGGDYILPGSSNTYLSMSDLNGLTKEECRIARNEIFARHGRKFDDETLQAYFKQFDWYKPVIEPDDFTDSMLNDYELKNLDLIVAYEEVKGYR